MSPYYSVPVLDRLFEHFVAHDGSPSGLVPIFEQPLFHRELVNVDTLRWFPQIVLYKPEHTPKILEVWINQTVLSQGIEDIDILFESLYRILLVVTPVQRILRRVRKALYWIMIRAEHTHSPYVNQDQDEPINILKLVTIDLEAEWVDGIGAPPIELRNFDFVTNMSDEEWAEWTTRIKILILGTRLGGLKYRPGYSKVKYIRDPDGVCLCGPMR
jgi:hypothetical protein